MVDGYLSPTFKLETGLCVLTQFESTTFNFFGLNSSYSYTVWGKDSDLSLGQS